MSLVELLIYAGAFLIGKWLLSQFIKSRSASNDAFKGTYLSAMRYVGFAIVFFFIGLVLGIAIIHFDLIDIFPHGLIVRGLAVAGLAMGLYIAYRYPSFLAVSEP